MKSSMIDSLFTRRALNALFTALTMAAIVTAAHADPILVNGNFSATTKPGSYGIGSDFTNNDDVTGWNTNGGYDFVYTSAAAAVAGSSGNRSVALYGNNGISASPDGGNFVAMDGAFETHALTQLITGLTPGRLVAVSFYYAGAQQSGFDGATTEALKVSLGSQMFETPILSNLTHGFTGWQAETFYFTPTTTSATLSFLAVGTPDGVPPFTLLDGVSVSQTPEPSSLALLATGLFSVGGVVRSRFKKSIA